jgi:pseudaminic acid cytidylyltransferase
MNIAIIPARGGSKRIPRKNIKVFAGKPMIVHSIDAALRCELFDRIVVSTDDQEIAEIAKKCGAEVPFYRDAALSDDTTGTLPVIKDAVLKLINVGWKVDFVCCIYPCAPFIDSKDLLDALRLLENSDARFSFPVTPYQNAIQRALQLDQHNNVAMFFPEHEFARSQDLVPAYHDTGQFYWGTAAAWINSQRIYQSSVGLAIPSWRVVDVDTIDDWQRAELIYEIINQKTNRLP